MSDELPPMPEAPTYTKEIRPVETGVSRYNGVEYQVSHFAWSQWRDDKCDALRARLVKAMEMIRAHNDACQDLCGRGDQEAVRCKYRPYFEANGRRCSECPTYWMIDDDAFRKQLQDEGLV